MRKIDYLINDIEVTGNHWEKNKSQTKINSKWVNETLKIPECRSIFNKFEM